MIPEFEYFILPTLNVLSDFKVHSLSEIKESVVKHFGFSKEELSETTRSGNNTKVNDRITWALTYLRQSGLVVSPQRAYAKITALGEKLLENPPKVITRDYLFTHYPSFRDFQNRRRKKKENVKVSITVETDFNKGPKQNYSINDTLNDLNNLYLALRSFEKIGIKPTQEQIAKLSELEEKVIKETISNKVKEIFNDDVAQIIKQFVVNIKYDNGQIYLHIDTSSQSFSTFPTNAILVKTQEPLIKIKEKRKRRPNLNFFDMGLITGDVLHYNDDPDISVTVVNENKVEYSGAEYSLTKLTQELKGLSHAIQPTGEWNFEGQNLLDLYNDTYKDE